MTPKRYEDKNLKIDSVKLRMESLDKAAYSVAHELIVRTIKIGANDIDFKISPETSKFVLRRDVLQSKSLIRLSVKGCKVKGGRVSFSKLKYLYLGKVILEGDLLWDVISSCPLIEDLELSKCKCWTKKKILVLNLSISPIHTFELRNLKKLFLEEVKIGSLFFSCFSSSFPCLKDLIVRYCSGYKNVQIYSQSLEFISFVHKRKFLKADFDVPSLSKFCFSGVSFLPSMSFPGSCNWESDISILPCRSSVLPRLVLQLNKRLTNLSLSKVSLFLQFPFIGDLGDCRKWSCLSKPLVENLTIDGRCSASLGLLYNLFQCCHPVFFTQHWDTNSSTGGKRNIELLEMIYRNLMILMSHSDLEDFSVGVFDEAVSGWRTLPWKSLLDELTSPIPKQRIRFHLRWG